MNKTSKILRKKELKKHGKKIKQAIADAKAGRGTHRGAIGEF